MALTWEKWLELYKNKEIANESVELLSRDATAENINQQETYYADGFKLLYTGVNPTNSQEGTIAPGRWGKIFTFERDGWGAQLFFDNYGTQMLTRSYDGAGWNGGDAATGADAWTRIMTGDIQRGLFINLSVPANGVLTHTINFPRPFVSAPPKLFLSVQRYAATCNLSAYIGQVSNTQGIAYVRNNLNVTEGINLHWMAIG